MEVIYFIKGYEMLYAGDKLWISTQTNQNSKDIYELYNVSEEREEISLEADINSSQNNTQKSSEKKIESQLPKDKYRMEFQEGRNLMPFIKTGDEKSSHEKLKEPILFCDMNE